MYEGLKLLIKNSLQIKFKFIYLNGEIKRSDLFEEKNLIIFKSLFF
jgi:hypothetical protein